MKMGPKMMDKIYSNIVAPNDQHDHTIGIEVYWNSNNFEHHWSLHNLYYQFL